MPGARLPFLVTLLEIREKARDRSLSQLLRHLISPRLDESVMLPSLSHNVVPRRVKYLCGLV